MSQLEFRFAQPGDEELVLFFIRQLAEYEHALEEVIATAEQLRDQLFVRKHAEVVFAMIDEQEIGLALFFHNFSTWLGRAGIYLEDLFVLPEYRGKGVGKALLAKLAQIAVERDCGRLEWSCLDWNEPSLNFYRSLGATSLDEWVGFRLEGASLEQLASL